MSDRSCSLPDSTPSCDRSAHPTSASYVAATQLLVEAHQLLAQTTKEQHARTQCLALLKTASPNARFFFQPTPPTLTRAVSRKPGSQRTATLVAQLTQAQQALDTRVDAIRLQTLFAISQLAFPVALWHAVIADPLPTTVEALAPPRAHSASRLRATPASLAPAAEPAASRLLE